MLNDFSKLFSDTNVNTEIPDMSGNFRTYGNPSLFIGIAKRDHTRTELFAMATLHFPETDWLFLD